ncbi:bifunctional UDP-N-acetylglucosamine diphosphorylase/glucosamine-1-phosphate N-acetyltransferase GlmU [Crystallibacter degradans]|uniref:bifunctional UDP-N-acetylglucosamine diphosphorylase/glucosamine-1-phosphate N-acetyltransferase GlmU n=1 Tax=Crystallibacter degradans TaxID=2726743 RepID=UPI003211EE61
MSPQDNSPDNAVPVIQPAAVIVLAAGAGTRMKSQKPKILHEIGGISMVGHALAAARGLEPKVLAAVVRHERDRVAAHIQELDPDALIVDQDEIPGTGRAVEAALEALPADLEGTVVVTYGDVPLLTTALLQELVRTHTQDSNAVTVLTAVLDDAAGYGRIVRTGDGTVQGIVEHKDATDAQREIREINSGIYAFDAKVLRDALKEITTDNAQGEKYLTDVLGRASDGGGRVAAVVTTDRWQVEGANDRVQLAQLGAEHNKRVLEAAMRSGVSIVDPATTWIDSTVTFGTDVTLLPGTQLHGSTHLATDAVVGPDCTLTNVTVGEGAKVIRTHGSDSRIGPKATVGPFTYLRPGTQLGEKGKIGAFYETKNVIIGKGSKLSHLGYAGDAEIGENSNIGCGNITANYDGVAKHRTIIGSEVRTGSNTVFVAPVQVGDGAYSGAGAVLRKDVPAGALALNVSAQRNIEGWVQQNRAGTAAAKAADAAASSQTPTNAESDHS